MYKKYNLVLFGIIIGFVLIGAGCTKSAPQPVPPDGSVSSKTAVDTSRVSVAELGFSYESIYSNPTRVVGSRLNFAGDIDFIERIERKPEQSFADAMQAFAKAHGATDAKCTFKTESVENNDQPFLSPGTEIGYIIPKSIPEPTKSELYTYLRSNKGGHVGATNQQLDELCKSTPECGWAVDDIYIGKARQACGPYVNLGGRIISLFMTSKDPSDPILFLFSLEGRGGSVPPFYSGPIEFLK